MKRKPSYEELEQKISLLKKEVDSLKKDRFNIKKTSAVITPEPLRAIFAAAQETVDRYFHEIKINPGRGTLEIGGERYTLIRAASLSYNLLNTIKDLYPNRSDKEAFSIGKNILFDISHMIGMNDARNFHKKMDLKDPIAKLSAGPVHFSYTGWALVEILPESRPTPDKNYFLIYHHPFSFESDAWIKSGKKAGSPVCIMNAGYSSGWCEESFGIPLTAVEIACKAKGDPQCTFIMAHPEKIEEYLRQYMSEIPIAKRKKMVYEIPTFFERKKMEDALRESEKRFKDISYSMADWIWEVDKNWKYIFVSGNVKQELGYEPGELIGKTPFEFMPVEEARRVKPLFNDIATRQKNIDELELWYITRQGQDICLLINGVPVFNEKKEPIGYRGIGKDITMNKRAAEELKKAKDDAEMANKVKSEFLATMSHEIRTPMNAIIGMSDLLLETALSQEQEDYAETVRNSAASLLSLLNDILDLSKMEAGKLQLEIIDFNLRVTIEEFVDMFILSSHKKGIEFAVLIPPTVPYLLRGDPSRLRQVLVNLTNNAIKFTETGEVSVLIRLLAENAKNVKIKFLVTDTGIGIAENFLNRLFSPFTQFDTSVTRKFGGTGLGLAISRQLIKLMDGEIGAESQVGKGSTFWFTVEFEKQTGGPDRKESYHLPGLRDRRLLIVDHHSLSWQMLKNILQQWTNRIEKVQSGKEALQKIQKAYQQKDPFKFAFIDMEMPGIDGEALGVKIRADSRFQDLTLILLAPIGEKIDKSRLKTLGFDAYISKPVKYKKLYEALLIMMGTKGKKYKRAAGDIIEPASLDRQKSMIKILLVEDNPINRKVFLSIVEKHGYQADVALNGREALKALEKNRYDLVFMDVQMPEMDGVTATRIIRDPGSGVRDHRVPIVAMTAHAMAGDRESYLEAGMDGYISKPVKSAKIIKTIEKYANRS